MSKPTQEEKFYDALKMKDAIYFELFPQIPRYSPDYSGLAKPDDCVLRKSDINVASDVLKSSVIETSKELSVRTVKRALYEMRHVPKEEEHRDVMDVLLKMGLQLNEVKR